MVSALSGPFCRTLRRIRWRGIPAPGTTSCMYRRATLGEQTRARAREGRQRRRWSRSRVDEDKRNYAVRLRRIPGAGLMTEWVAGSGCSEQTPFTSPTRPLRTCTRARPAPVERRGRRSRLKTLGDGWKVGQWSECVGMGRVVALGWICGVVSLWVWAF